MSRISAKISGLGLSDVSVGYCADPARARLVESILKREIQKELENGKMEESGVSNVGVCRGVRDFDANRD
ncbi:MAG: hypothetical protein A3F54_04060 [Candidatus Kerfeldbacteria bacterium RIFCSPHIGHO2_12_FULL_48_17]|uniref:Uncharacterized protein n=1 Tax=Candidatus Kerfeldbacteria bacterium RIFCSPHIGHO2_12_FULL_48_17 TaxID=1798542 RepID=A0A1G2AYV9_9BACT|nr:MAG: hypothetical protein A3F54_04060 [Candidatus Kerfeldbacteria bacterium RIFCSPHIGHO2_12_FULL_48_17]